MTSSLGLKVHGYLHSSIGLGHAARSYVRAAQRCQRLNVSWNTIRLAGRDQKAYAQEFPLTKVESDVELAVCGLDHIDNFFHLQSENTHRIGCPFWELSKISGSIQNLHLHDSVWVASTFIEKAVNQFFDELHISVRPDVFRIPIAIPQKPQNDYSSNNRVFRVLVSFDVNSWVTRKNPLSALKAFQVAFPTQNDVELIIKTNPVKTRLLKRLAHIPNSLFRLGQKQVGEARFDLSKLKALAAHDKRVRVIEASLTQTEMDSLYSSINAYLSLHRSEGFGLGIAEALARQIPTVATDYGGNTDFLTESTGFPVSYDLKALDASDYFEGEGNVWAEPSIEDAASSLRAIYDDFSGALERAQNGRRFIETDFSQCAVARLIDNALPQMLD